MIKITIQPAKLHPSWPYSLIFNRRKKKKGNENLLNLSICGAAVLLQCSLKKTEGQKSTYNSTNGFRVKLSV